jgi:hypothetical protein
MDKPIRIPRRVPRKQESLGELMLGGVILFTIILAIFGMTYWFFRGR